MVRLDARQVDEARLLRGWTWGDLGAKCGLASATRTRIANGKPVSIGTARRVCETLRLPLRRVLILPSKVDGEKDQGGPVAVAVGGR